MIRTEEKENRFAEDTQDIPEEDTPKSENQLWGTCRVTAYCPCEKCCGIWATKRPKDPTTGESIVYGSSGEQLIPYYSCASSLPFGTKLYIPELDLTLEVQDRTAKYVEDMYDGKIIDIYIDDHLECFEFIHTISEYTEVFIVNEY